MAKRKNPEEAFTAFLGDTQTADDRSTDERQPADERQTADTLQRYNVRIAPSDWQRLKKAAAAEGTSTSAIIRRLIKQYLRNV
jgi:predicted DNA binding CopG/RHH family protein